VKIVHIKGEELVRGEVPLEGSEEADGRFFRGPMQGRGRRGLGEIRITRVNAALPRAFFFLTRATRS
jgi:hypothetical protein